MKYRLINSVTKLETICYKVTIDGFDYYVSPESKIFELDFFYHKLDKEIQQMLPRKYQEYRNNNYQCFDKIIATNNTKVDIPKVVNDVEKIADYYLPPEGTMYRKWVKMGYIAGYEKTIERHPFSKYDIIEFHKWAFQYVKFNESDKTTEELLELWLELVTKTIYYE
jgi:hypothetical protein